MEDFQENYLKIIYLLLLTMLSVIFTSPVIMANVGSLYSLVKPLSILLKNFSTDKIYYYNEEQLHYEEIQKYFGKRVDPKFHQDAVQYNEGYPTFNNKKEYNKKPENLPKFKDDDNLPQVDETIFGKMNSRYD